MGRADHPSQQQSQSLLLTALISPLTDGRWRTNIYWVNGSLKSADGTMPPYHEHGSYEHAEAHVEEAIGAIAKIYASQQTLKTVTMTYALVEEDGSLDDADN